MTVKSKNHAAFESLSEDGQIRTKWTQKHESVIENQWVHKLNKYKNIMNKQKACFT